MDPRAPQRWPESGRRSQRPGDREDHRWPAPQGGGHYPPPDSRWRDWQWPHPEPDPPFRGYLASPAPRPPFPPGSYTDPQARATHAYDSPEHPPHSRHGYDFPAHGHWDYREDYVYYDHGYYRGHYGHPDAGHWAPRESWSSNPHHDRRYEQEQSGNAYREQYRYDQGKGSSQHDLSGHEEDRVMEKNGDCYREASYYDTGNLTRSKTSGLSSSGYELSQYISADEQSDPVRSTAANTEGFVAPQVTAPLKYPTPHAVTSFGPAGQLIRVSPGLVTQGDPGQLEIHSMEIILGETQEQQEMRDFPGPLAREDHHKVDAISFAHQRAEACMRDDKLQDKESAALLWNFLILLCRQNGRIVGSDVAELLIGNSPSLGASCDPEPPSLIDLTEGPAPETEPLERDDLLTGHGSGAGLEASQQALRGYTKLLLAGRKKEALEAATKTGLWGHTLFLASKMDNRSYTTVLNRFTGQLAMNDPVQTLFQMLSGRTPAVAMCYGSDKWGDWKPHLAVMLSNGTGDTGIHQKAIITMGDTLASRGLLHAAHVCFLTASAPFGVYTSRAEKIVLLGSSHCLPFLQFAKNVAIQCTEMFEYCQRLGDKSFSIPSFQVYKFLYACRLLDCGLVSQASHYCEVVGGALLQQDHPSPALSGEVIKLAERLGHWERQLSGAAVARSGQDPDWLRQLRHRHQETQMGSYGGSDTYQSPAEESALAHEENTEYSETESDDLSTGGAVTGDVQDPSADLLYYRGPEEDQAHMYQVNASPPARGYNQPAVPLMAGGQHYGFYSAGSAHVQSGPLHPVLGGPFAGNAGAAPFTGTGMTGAQVNAGAPAPEHRQGVPGQQAIPQERQTSGLEVQPTQTPPSGPGWFSSWFKSKPRDEDDANADPTESPPPSLFPPQAPPTTMTPPTTMAPPMTMYPPAAPSQASSAGINPFSRKAGQQLG